MATSVSVTETALSCILSADWKKIQKAVDLDLTTSETLKINESVIDMANLLQH